MADKMTISNVADVVIKVMNGELTVEDISEANKNEIIERQKKIIEQANAKKEKSTSKENEDSLVLMGKVRDILAEADTPLSIPQIMEKVTDYVRKDGKALSSNMVNSVMIKMGDKGTHEVVKEYVKKVAYFSLRKEEEVDG